MNISCDCIVPFFNEGMRPLSVVESILKVKNLSKIIVVDDGSADTSICEELRTEFPEIILIRLEKNTGKTNAVKVGLKQAVAKYVILIDGDLSDIKTNEIEKAIEKITHNPDIDMIILSVVTDLMKKDWFRWYTILSGQRILRKEDLSKIYQKNFSGFQLEAAINDYMINNKKKSYWMPSSIRNISKYRKWGRVEGIRRFFSLVKEFSDYTGWRNLVWQTLFFCRTEAP